MNTFRRARQSFSNFRLNVLLVTFLGLFFVVDLRLFQIQILGHSKYEQQAQQQYWDAAVIPAKRGDILSSDGFVLAGTQSKYLLFAEPKRIDDKYKLAHDAAATLSNLRTVKDTAGDFVALEEAQQPQEIQDNIQDASDKEAKQTQQELFSEYYQTITDALSQEDLQWIPLFRNLTPIERDAISALNISGLGFEESPARYYPEGTLAANVLGFVGDDASGNRQGYFGIEGALNDDLRGRSGRIVEETDATGAPILTGGYKKIPPVEGRGVVLTINRAVQYMVEKLLKEGVEKYDAVSGDVIVMNPQTDEIIAMANYPTYSPAEYYKEDDSSQKSLEGDESKDSSTAASTRRKSIEKRNLAIAQTYEPGSVIKGFTVSAGVDLSLISPESTFEDNGPAKYSDYTINNWNGVHYGTQTIIQLLQKSNNIGAAWVGTKVGREQMYKYFTNFGLGTRTGIDLEGEDTGVIWPANQWTDIDLATASFGQGISATPLQVLNGYNAIANGGYLMEPKIISEIKDPRKTIEIPSKTVRRVISKKSSDTMVGLLEKAAEGGEAQYFVLKNYRIAGKTGTAQIPENGKYSPNRTNATFVGFLVGSRNVSMIVRLTEPHTSIYAAETAVPLWMNILNELVKFYGIAPDKDSNAPIISQPGIGTATH